MGRYAGIVLIKRTVPRTRGPRRAPAQVDSPVLELSGKDTALVGGSLLAAGVSSTFALRDSTQSDKLKHFGVVGAGTVALGALGVPAGWAAASSFTGASLGKELIYDLWLGKGNASWHDVGANLGGALAGYALLKLYEAD